MSTTAQRLARPQTAQQLVAAFRARSLRPHTYLNPERQQLDAAAAKAAALARPAPPKSGKSGKSSKKARAPSAPAATTTTTPTSASAEAEADGPKPPRFVRCIPAAAGYPATAHAHNPFLPTRPSGAHGGGNTKRGHWAPPRVPLRRQAQLVKAATAAGLAHLLPPGPKLRVPPPAPEGYYASRDAASAEAAQLRKAEEARLKAEAEKLAEQERTRAKREAQARIEAAFFGARATVGGGAGSPAAASETAAAEEPKAAAEKPASVLNEREIWALRAQAPKPDWDVRVNWVGAEMVSKARPASRVYAGRRRMFKGHQWERVRGKRVGKRRVLMRDMAKRIRKFKNVSVEVFFSGLDADANVRWFSSMHGGGRIRSRRLGWQRPPSCPSRIISHSVFSCNTIRSHPFHTRKRAFEAKRLALIEHIHLSINPIQP
jgi:large subunit ribosomal protein L25